MPATFIVYDRMTRKCGVCGASVRYRPMLVVNLAHRHAFVCERCYIDFENQVHDSAIDLSAKLD